MGWRGRGGLEPQVRCDTNVHQWTARSVLGTACCARPCARWCSCCSSHCAQASCCYAWRYTHWRSHFCIVNCSWIWGAGSIPSTRKPNQHCLDHQTFHAFSLALEIFTGLPVLDHSDVCFRKELWRSDPTNQVQENTSILNPASNEMISDSVELFRNWSLFLTHPTYRNKCMTSKNAQCSTRRRFWILNISFKIGVLKQSQSALFCSVTPA